MEKTILFGNGINLLSQNALNWNNLLEELKEARIFENGNLPNTLIFERIVLEKDKVDLKSAHLAEKNIKDRIANNFQNIPTNPFYKRLFELGCKNYMTTNYDYAFIKCLSDVFTIKNNSTEEAYNIRRNTSILKDNKEVTKIWNIHGEINKPSSIMLGLDHYCGTIGKLDGYLKGTYEFFQNKKKVRVRSLFKKVSDKKYDGYSWIELFFTTDIHIVGLSMDYSETDLWWVLNKRARTMYNGRKKLIKNNIYFYTDQNISKEKEELLHSFKVKVIKDTVVDNDWGGHYNRILDQIGEE
ncbi:SIR2 family protein [Flammeovirga aprica]|uniref:SIR2-like domain-containing protein n=1 Tax=Flammeovirga aprica JL-4 TaxID=694437 RepID=A0A7X9S0Y6_9BACT|nr:SIR2 family protein [Flammeovirga aprica]NME72234.1 hypothetical protein [Flammeovirga aprica JL-4]